jgi:hypothetical protein
MGGGLRLPSPSYQRAELKSDNLEGDEIKLAKAGESAPRQQKNDRPRGEIYTAYDRDLIKAAQEQTRVSFTLADGTKVEGTIIKVDKFQVEILRDSDGAVRASYSTLKEWLNKSLIMRTRIG